MRSRATATPLTTTPSPLGKPALWSEQLVGLLMGLLRWPCGEPMCARDVIGARQRRAPPGRSCAPHDLIAAPAEIPDRRTPHVHEPGERKHQEDGHAEEEVQLEDGID